MAPELPGAFDRFSSNLSKTLLSRWLCQLHRGSQPVQSTPVLAGKVTYSPSVPPCHLERVMNTTKWHRLVVEGVVVAQSWFQYMELPEQVRFLRPKAVELLQKSVEWFLKGLLPE